MKLPGTWAFTVIVGIKRRIAGILVIHSLGASGVPGRPVGTGLHRRWGLLWQRFMGCRRRFRLRRRSFELESVFFLISLIFEPKLV